MSLKMSVCLSGIAWRGTNPGFVLTSGKDGCLCLHEFASADEPLSKVSPVAVGIAPTGRVAHAFNNKLAPSTGQCYSVAPSTGQCYSVAPSTGQSYLVADSEGEEEAVVAPTAPPQLASEFCVTFSRVKRVWFVVFICDK